MGTPLTARLYMNELGIKCLLVHVAASVDDFPSFIAFICDPYSNVKFRPFGFSGMVE